MYIYEGCTREEVEAMRDLQTEPFDFGTGLIEIPNGGEEAYYEMELECFEWDYLLDGFTDYHKRYEQVMKENEFTKDKSRAKRRKNNFKKSIRTQKLAEINFGNALEDKPLNHFNKGKAFCSCSLCKEKTNPKGKLYFSRSNGKRINYKQRNWKHSDQKNIDMTNSKLKDNYEDWRYLDYADYEARQWGLIEDWDCHRYYEEYLAEIELYKEQERLWNEEYEKNKEYYDSLDDY